MARSWPHPNCKLTYLSFLKTFFQGAISPRPQHQSTCTCNESNSACWDGQLSLSLSLSLQIQYRLTNWSGFRDIHAETCPYELPVVLGLISPSTWEEFAENPRHFIWIPAARSRLISKKWTYFCESSIQKDQNFCVAISWYLPNPHQHVQHKESIVLRVKQGGNERWGLPEVK